jgi:hypothetical protein
MFGIATRLALVQPSIQYRGVFSPKLSDQDLKICSPHNAESKNV